MPSDRIHTRVTARIAAIIVAQAGAHGACTETDLAIAGFTVAEAAAHGETAVARATTEMARRGLSGGRSLNADR